MAEGKIIGIAIDGSSQAEYAFNYAVENIYKKGDTILLVHCSEYTAPVGLFKTNVEEVCAAMTRNEEQISRLTTGYIEQLKKREIPARVQKTQGKPGESICAVFEQNGVNHIVMGTRGLGKIRRTFMGSVSEFIVHHVHVPVTVVPSPQGLESQK